MSRGVFVVGTGTGVGKTIVAGALAANFRYLHDRPVGVFKPAESGVGPEGPPDARFLATMAGVDDDMSLICPFPHALAAAPAAAAEAEGATIDPDRLVESFDILVQRHGFVIVEGAGGLLVPYAEQLLTLDLIRLLGLPVLLVAPVRLGTVNHTLLTLRALAAAGVPLLGLVLNHPSSEDAPGERCEEALIRRHAPDAPILGRFPYLPDADADDPLWRARAADRIEHCVDLWPAYRLAAPA
jgi:dethiobiotin synthetase